MNICEIGVSYQQSLLNAEKTYFVIVARHDFNLGMDSDTTYQLQ